MPRRGQARFEPVPGRAAGLPRKGKIVLLLSLASVKATAASIAAARVGLEIVIEVRDGGRPDDRPLRPSLTAPKWVCAALAVGLLIASATPAWSQTGDPYAAYQRGEFAAAARAFEPLAVRGDADAQYGLAVLYDLGRGVARDLQAAAAWYRQAAEQGVSEAQFNLGAMYANGEGVAEDMVSAYAFLALAAAQGHAEAASQRDAVAGYLTREQIAAARRIAKAVQARAVPQGSGDRSVEDRIGPSGGGSGRGDTVADRLFDDRLDPIFGNPDGNVTVVEFFDYRCPYCRKVTERLLATVKRDGNIRLVFKELPILGSRSDYAARAALAAKNQGRYLDFHRALMRSNGRLTRKRVLSIANSVGVDTVRLRADMQSPEIDDAIAANRDMARKLGIGGTPAFVIADRTVRGAVSMASIRKHVAKAR